MIVQVNPQHAVDVRGQFLRIDKVETWGVVAVDHENGKHNLAWEGIELTGGTQVWDVTGALIVDRTPQVKHHA